MRTLVQRAGCYDISRLGECHEDRHVCDRTGYRPDVSESTLKHLLGQFEHSQFYLVNVDVSLIVALAR